MTSVQRVDGAPGLRVVRVDGQGSLEARYRARGVFRRQLTLGGLSEREARIR